MRMIEESCPPLIFSSESDDAAACPSFDLLLEFHVVGPNPMNLSTTSAGSSRVNEFIPDSYFLLNLRNDLLKELRAPTNC